MNNRFRNIPLLFSLAFVTALVLFAQSNVSQQKSGQAQTPLPTRELVLNGRRLVVEIADEPEEQRRGLSFRPSLCRECGMLFVYPEAARQRFWMRGMRFPLDMVFINGNQIVHIAENVAAKGGIPVVVSPTKAADKVLELNAGMAAELGLKTGFVIGGA